MPSNFQKSLENGFETFLWKGRLITLLAVLFSFFSSLALFIAGSKKIVKSIFSMVVSPALDEEYTHLLVDIITAVDLYLIAVVLLIFSFGLYELFISKIDLARDDKDVNILEIKSLDDLKTRLFKVIIMALIVYFFKSILNTHFEKPMEMLVLGVSILAISASSIFIRKME